MSMPLLMKKYKCVSASLTAILLFCTHISAQVSTGFFNGTVFSTYSSVNGGSLAGNNFTVTYGGSFFAKNLVTYTPGALPANSGYPVTLPDMLGVLGNASNTTITLDFNSTLPRFTTFFLQDLDYSEEVIVEFFDASNTLVNTSSIIYATISTNTLPAASFSVTSATVTGVSTNTNERLVAFVLNTATVRTIKITQLSGSTGGSYEMYLAQQGTDHGDAPISYGDAAHFPFSYLMLGSLSGDTETNSANSVGATGDDAAVSADVIDDEDGVASFNNLYTSTTSYSVSVAVTNTTGANATLVGWIDFNRDGVFNAGEASAPVMVANGATSATVSWTGLSGLVSGQSYARFRIASNPAEVSSPTGVAINGEVEDYAVTIRSILPLFLVNFSGERQGNDIRLNWRTENEQQVNHFDIEYSTDGINYAKSGSVAARNQPSNNYQFTLLNYTAPVYYLRLKSVDRDGKSKYSSIIVVRMSGRLQKLMVVSPNPIQDRISVRIISDVAAAAGVHMLNSAGQVLYQTEKQLVKGENALYFNPSLKLTNGIYIITAVVDGERLTQKIMISR